MQTGVLSSENLAQVLRGIAQKRKQGILEVTNGEQVLQIMFVAGKIVEAFQSLDQALQEIITKIGAAGVLPADFSSIATNYAELFVQLEHEGCVLDLDEYKVVIKQRILGELYNLNLPAGAFYSFKVQMVEIEDEFMPTISVGQLLLDLVSLKDDEQKFYETFPSDHAVRLTDDLEGNGIEEGFLLHALKSHVHPAEIEAACMLSTFHFREVLLSLFTRGFVTVRQVDEEDVAEESRSLDDIVAALEGGIDTEVESFDLDSIELLAPTPAVPDRQVDIEQVTVIGEHVQAQNCRNPVQEEVVEAVRISRLGVLNARLLQADWVPGLLVLLFLFFALFTPFLSWDSCLSAFSNFK